MRYHSFLLLSVLVGTTQCQEGVFRFAHHYGDNMVLQRAPARAIVWGYREDQQPVNVLIRGHGVMKYATIEATGNATIWRAVLPPMHADGSSLIIEASSIVGNKHVSISINNILFGDIWMCGGQSNMQFPTAHAFNAQKERDLAKNYPMIRLFTVRQYTSSTPVHEIDPSKIAQKWQIPTADSINGFSCICWMYGRRLHDILEIPIGLVSSNWGGTPVEAWSSPEAMAECYSDQIRYIPEIRPYNPTVRRNQPYRVRGPRTPSALWNSMIVPFLNMTIQGSIWYQGEQNAWAPATYNCTFPAMIRDWRRKWESGTSGYIMETFPFGFVQLSTLGVKYDPKLKLGFPIIRWKQTAEYGYVPNPHMPRTFMAVALDLPDNISPFGGIHPRDKTDVSDRLVLGAMNVAYDTDTTWTGPIFESWNQTKLDENYRRVNVTFKKDSIHPTKGIQIRDVNGFEVFVTTRQDSPPSPPIWLPIPLTLWKANWVSSTFLFPASLEVLGVRYNWDQQPCRFKSCAVYSDNLPAPPFMSMK